MIFRTEYKKGRPISVPQTAPSKIDSLFYEARSAPVSIYCTTVPRTVSEDTAIEFILIRLCPNAEAILGAKRFGAEITG